MYLLKQNGYGNGYGNGNGNGRGYGNGNGNGNGYGNGYGYVYGNGYGNGIGSRNKKEFTENHLLYLILLQQKELDFVNDIDTI